MLLKKRKNMTPAGFEPATLRPGIESSTGLSHEATVAQVDTQRQIIYYEAPETIEFEFQLCPFAFAFKILRLTVLILESHLYL